MSTIETTETIDRRPDAPVARPQRHSTPRRRKAAASLIEMAAPRPEVKHPLTLANAALAAGSMLSFIDIPWWPFAIVGAIGALTSLFVTVGRHGGPCKEALFNSLTAAAAGAWLAWVAHTTLWWSTTSWTAWGVGLAVCWPLYALMRWKRDKAGRAAMTRRALEREAAKRNAWEKLFVQSKIKGVKVVNEVAVAAAGVKLSLELGLNAPDFRTLKGSLPTIERVAAASMKLPVRAGSISLERADGAMAHEATMFIPTEDVLGRTYDVPEHLHGPASINNPLEVARSADGTTWGPLLRGVHGMFSGMTNFGKTVLLDAHLCGLVRCVDNTTFCIAGNKAVRWLRPWLRPWLEGRASRPAIDWVTGDVDEALRVLLDIYRAIDGRQGMPDNGTNGWEPSAEQPQITLLVDESTDLFTSRKTVMTHKGERVTFAELLLTIIRTARSEAICVVFCSQRSTNGMLGDFGGDTKSQVGYRVGLRHKGFNDANSVFSTDTTGIDLSNLPKGAFYVEFDDYERPKLEKGYWVSPAAIDAYAVEASQYVGGVDQPTAGFMEHYAGRWSRPGQLKFLEQVNGGPLPARLLQVLTGDSGDLDTAPAAATTGVTGPERNDAELGREAARQLGYDSGPILDRIRARAAAEARGPVAETAEELDALFAAEAIAHDNRTNNTPREPDQPALSDDALGLLSVLRAGGFLQSAEEWVPSVDVRVAGAKRDLWPNNTHGDRIMNNALRELGVDPDDEANRKRITREGTKMFHLKIAALSDAAERHRYHQ